MRLSTLLPAMVLLILVPMAKAADSPLTETEKMVTAKLTRMRSLRLWWNHENRVIGAAFKGASATDSAVRLAGQLSVLKTLVLMPVHDEALTNEGLAPLANIPQLELLSISGGHLNDSAMAHLKHLTGLRTLILNGAFTDQALATIAQLSKLEVLDLAQSDITGEGLQQLAGLAKLETLILNGTPITPTGFEQIAQIKQLSFLCLADTPLDDSAIKSLTRLTNLDVLVITGTRITRQGIQKLQAAFSPRCDIIHQSGRYSGSRNEPPLARRTASR